MNVNGMQKIKDFARSLGYIVDDTNWRDSRMFTIRYPLAYDEYNTVVDFTWNSLNFVDICEDDVEKLVERYIDSDDQKYTTYKIEEIRPKFIKEHLVKKWMEYKNYLIKKKIDEIGKDFE